MARSPKDVVLDVLHNFGDEALVHRLVAKDAVYVSLNDDNPELKRIMPWAGTSRGPEGVFSTFARVAQYWHVDAFDIEVSLCEGEHVAVFGHVKFRSTVMGKAVQSPFAVLARVKDGQIAFMQFMEDTFATGASFRSGGSWKFRSDPNGGEVEI
jgi:ketosteroid isomerase-like protein